MAKNLLNTVAVFSSIVTVILIACYAQVPSEILFSLLITFATITYHLVMRIAVGVFFDRAFDNKMNYEKRWFQASSREMAIYEKLKVKSWKGKLPTYNASTFDLKKHTLVEVALAMCQAELVHETIAILSFLPIIAGIWFGDFPVFIITSLAAAAVDMSFVIIQRYNRQRIMKIFINSLSRTGEYTAR